MCMDPSFPPPSPIPLSPPTALTCRVWNWCRWVGPQEVGGFLLPCLLLAGTQGLPLAHRRHPAVPWWCVSVACFWLFVEMCMFSGCGCDGAVAVCMVFVPCYPPLNASSICPHLDYHCPPLGVESNAQLSSLVWPINRLTAYLIYPRLTLSPPFCRKPSTPARLGWQYRSSIQFGWHLVSSSKDSVVDPSNPDSITLELCEVSSLALPGSRLLHAALLFGVFSSFALQTRGGHRGAQVPLYLGIQGAHCLDNFGSKKGIFKGQCVARVGGQVFFHREGGCTGQPRTTPNYSSAGGEAQATHQKVTHPEI